MITAAAFVVAAAAGALARAEAGRRWNQHGGLAVSTLIVNVTGSFLLGLGQTAGAGGRLRGRHLRPRDRGCSSRHRRVRQLKVPSGSLKTRDPGGQVGKSAMRVFISSISAC